MAHADFRKSTCQYFCNNFHIDSEIAKYGMSNLRNGLCHGNICSMSISFVFLLLYLFI